MTTSSRLRWCLWLFVALASVLLLACTRKHAPVTKQIAPALLSTLVLAPGDVGDAYAIESDGYVDQDGKRVATPTRQYQRQFRARETAPATNPPAVATVILITLADQGVDSATEFVDTADDEQVGPANLADYIEQRIQGSHDVHAELVSGFPSYDDNTVANRLSWHQTVNGVDETVRAYGVYIRSGGLLALVALRAPADANGAEPEGLYRQTETVAHKQADKLKGPIPPAISPR